MPTRTLQQFSILDVQQLYTQFLSGQPGWSGGSADDIESIEWDGTAKTLTVIRVPEPTRQRRITYSQAELWNAINGLPQWSGSVATDLMEVRINAAGRKIIVVRAPEAA